MALTKDRYGRNVNTEKVFGLEMVGSFMVLGRIVNYSSVVKKYKTASSAIQAMNDTRKCNHLYFYQDSNGVWVREPYEVRVVHVYYDLFPKSWGLKNK